MATPFTRGLRALRIPASAFASCRPCTATYTFYSLRRQLSTSVPRFSAAAQATVVKDESKPVTTVEEVADERTLFSTLKGKVSKETLRAITVRPMNHTHMTPVQEAVLAMLPELSEPLKKKEDGTFEIPSTPRDLMVRAKTGTGKTLAFLVPAIEARAKAIEEAGKEAQARAGSASDKRLVENARKTFANTHVGALILTPTRELAKQVATEAERLSTHHEFQVHMFRGGDSKSQQIRDWRRGRKDIVVATTGRLLDLMNSEPTVLEAIQTAKLLILDEADTMLDMGFRPDIEEILPELPPTAERQTFVFSATISKTVQDIVRKTLSKNHVFINTVPEEDSGVHEHIPQYHTVLPSAAEQLPHTLRLIAHDQLTNPGKSKVIVFLPTTKLTQMYAKVISEVSRAVLPAGRDTTVYELHSKRSMASRNRTSDHFRRDTSGACVLVTSDVSARGVDYPGVTRVIQLGIPVTSDQYTHRVGRTGRVGGAQQGRGDLVLLPWEHGFIREALFEFPLKPVTSHDLAQQVHEIAQRYDEDPESFFPKDETTKRQKTSFGRSSERTRGAPLSQFRSKVAARLQAMKEEVDEVLSAAVDEEEVKEAFSSLLGFYVGKQDELRTSRNAILEGLRDWSVQAAGLPSAPHVSEAFLNRIGFSSDRNNRQFERQHLRGRSGSIRSPMKVNRWDGRGSVKAKRERTQASYENKPERRRRDDWPPRRDSNDRYDRRERGSDYERKGRRSTWPSGRDD